MTREASNRHKPGPEVPLAPMVAPQMVLCDDGCLRHLGSGFIFPPSLGALPRTEVKLYDDLEQGVGVTYRSSEAGRPWATLFVFPGRPGCGILDAFRGSEIELVSVHEEVVVRGRRRFAVSFEGARRALGMGLEVTAKCGPASLPEVPIRAHLLVLQAANWFLKVRVTVVEEHARSGLALLSLALKETIRRYLSVLPESDAGLR